YEKYDICFSSGVVASAGTLGIIIPPSIPLIIYGITTNTSIGDLFIAGVTPGLLIAVSLWGISYIISKKNHFTGTGEKATWKERWQYLNHANWTLMLPVVGLGVIHGGIFTANESEGAAGA